MTEWAQAPVVELTEVTKSYRAGKLDVSAVKGISLAIPRERFSMLVGPSGSGKTTLLNLIGCIDTPSTGKVTVDGQDVAALADNALSDFRAHNVGFIFQNFSLIPVLSAYENIEYPLMLLGEPTQKRRERTMAILEAVGLLDQRNQRPNQLSGGQKQRVAIGRALVKDPALVLADEPTANLDSKTGAAIIELMHQMQQQFATTFVFSTHDPQLMSHADETFAIRDGVLVEHTSRAPQC